MQKETDPDPDWVARLAGVSVPVAERALEEAEGEHSLFRHIESEHRREGRSSYIEIDAPLELYAIARLTRPRHVVEVGVSSGVSSAYLLAALSRNQRGTLHSIDRPKVPPHSARKRPSPNASWSLPPGRSSGWAVPTSLRTRWDLRIGDKKIVLPLLGEELPAMDLFVYDVPHDDDDARREFTKLDQILSRRGVAIADHGPGAGLCPSLAGWARRRGATAIGRSGLGLYGFRASS